MEMKITGKNFELAPEVRQYIERKIGKLDRHLSNIIEAKFEISEEKTRSPQHRYIAQVTVNSSGTLLRGEERGEDLFTAIDKVSAIIQRQVERFKGKRDQKKGGVSVRSVPAVEESPLPRVVKVKHFPVKSMTVDEAQEQMELLGHDFFLFLNTDNMKLNLIYKRKDGNYGLIEPEPEQAE